MSVQIEFLSAGVVSPMSGSVKIDYILNAIKKDKILVLEESLSHAEERTLITETMKRVSKKFPGIEVSTLGSDSDDAFKNFLIRMLGGKVGGITVIGPSTLVKQLKRDPDKIRLLASSR